MTTANILRDARACGEAIEWAKSHPDPADAWAACERGDWMLWIWGRLRGGEPMSDARRPIVLAVCECARLALRYVPDDEGRPREAIELAERWARGGDVSCQELRKAAYAAYADAAARKDTLRECTKIVRRHCPTPPLPTEVTR